MDIPAVDNCTRRYVSLQELMRQRPGIYQLDQREYAKSGLLWRGGRASEFIRCEYCPFVISPHNAVGDIWKEHATSMRRHCLHIVSSKGIQYISHAQMSENGNLESRTSDEETNGTIAVRGISNIELGSEHRAKAASEYLAKLLDVPRGSAIDTYETFGGARFAPAHTPEMLDVECRRETFRTIDALYQEVLPVSELANAGYYYTEPRDSIRCYYCDVAIPNWRECVDYRHPWVMHAKENHRCMYLLTAMGEELVTSLKHGMTNTHGHRKRKGDVDEEVHMVTKRIRQCSMQETQPHA